MKEHQTDYIHDGCTLEGYIAAKTGLHSAVQFAYRPMLMKDRLIVQKQIKEKPVVAAERVKCQAICSQLVSWDLCQQNGEEVPINPEAMMRVNGTITDRLFFIVCQVTPTDINPEWTAEQQQEEDERELAEALGNPVSFEEEQAGN